MIDALTELSQAAAYVKVADTLYFVIGEFDVEMVFDAREEFEGLQGVDAKFFEEIVFGRECAGREFEVRGGEIQHFLGGLLESGHDCN